MQVQPRNCRRQDLSVELFSTVLQILTFRVNTTGNQNTTGNAATATKLQTARNINGVPFDGTKDITLTPKDLDAYSKSEVQSALAGKQPLDNTLTNLSGKDVAGLLAYLQLGEAAKRDVGTGNNQLRTCPHLVCRETDKLPGIFSQMV